MMSPVMESLDPRLRNAGAGSAAPPSHQSQQNRPLSGNGAVGPAAAAAAASSASATPAGPASGTSLTSSTYPSGVFAAGPSPDDAAGDTPQSSDSQDSPVAGAGVGVAGGGSGSGATSGGANGAQGEDPKKPRACEACRGLKVRCEPDPANPDGACRRCARAGRECIVTQPTRKRQKKTDSRVAELEKKIDALTASLQATRGAGAPAGLDRPPGPPARVGLQGNVTGSKDQGNASTGGSGPSYGMVKGYSREWDSNVGIDPSRQQQQQPQPQQAQSPYSQPFQPPMVMAGQKRKVTESRGDASSTDDGSRQREASAAGSVPAAATPVPQSSLGNDYADIVDRGILTMEKATEFFMRYNEQMAPHLPGVVFPQTTTAAEVRRSKPILFLALMAASSSEMPNVQRVLVKELMQLFAEKIIIIGEKSIELVQALQVAVIWYWPPEHFEELKFYQLIHMAAVMAIDIGLGRKGLGRKRNPLQPMAWRDHPFKKHPLPDPTSIESRRAWLTCYFLASNSAMALHRPNLVRWNGFLTECFDVLESSPEAAPTDKYLCHLVWTHSLAEEIGVQFSMDDPTARINVSDPKVQYALRGFERDLDKYSSSVPREEQGASLVMSFHILSLYMHEIALHGEDGERDTFKPPFAPDNLREAFVTDGPLTPARINALSACLTAIDGILETFLAMDIASVRSLPVFNFVRVAYATVVLMKMYFAASAPDSELGKIINKDNMKVEQHLDALLDKFRKTAAADRSRPAAKFLVVLVMVRSWFQKQKESSAEGVRLGAGEGPGSGGYNAADMMPVAPSMGQQGMPAQGNRSASASSAPTPNAPQQQQQQPDYSSKANTPLELLSEVATNNSNPSNAMGLPPYAFLPQQRGNLQPFMYDSGDPATPTTPTTQTRTPPDNALRSMAPNPSAPPLPYLSSAFNSDFDYASLGDGFAHAMDMTLAGFGDGNALLQFPDLPGAVPDAWFGSVMDGMMPGANPGYPF